MTALESLAGARDALRAEQVDALILDLDVHVSARLDELGVRQTRNTALGVGLALVGVAGVLVVRAGGCPEGFCRLAVELLRKAVLVRGCTCEPRPADVRVNATGGRA